MSTLEHDPIATARRLEAWLTAAVGIEHPEVTNVDIPGATGWSNETVFFDAAWRNEGAPVQRKLVARIAPTRHTVFPDDTFLAQYEIMRALASCSDVPVAQVHWLEEDTSWFGSPMWVMERIDGDIPTDVPSYAGAGWLHDATVDDQERAWWSGIEAMAAIHRVDLAELDAVDIRGGAGSVAEQLDHLEGALTWAEEGVAHPLARRAVQVLRANLPKDPTEGPALSWGDARLSNLIYRDFEVVAVLDWEMMSIGDPLLDLGWWLFADDALTLGGGCARLPGFPDAATTAARWSELTGRSAEALGFYELFAALRFTVIMLKMGKLLADMGLVPEGFDQDNLITDALQLRLDRDRPTELIQNI